MIFPSRSVLLSAAALALFALLWFAWSSGHEAESDALPLALPTVVEASRQRSADPDPASANGLSSAPAPTAEPREEAPASQERWVLRGHVRKLDEAAPLASFRVRIEGGGALSEEVQVDAQGDFAFSLTRPEQVELSVHCADPWRVHPSTKKVAADRIDGEPVTFSAWRWPARDVELRLVDRYTKSDPIPWYTLGFDDGERRVRVTSDERGRLTLPAHSSGLPALLDLYDRDDGVRIGTHQIDATAIPYPRDPGTLRVPTGPTYLLDVDLPPGLTHADFMATLSSERTGPRHRKETPLRTEPIGAQRWDLWARFPDTPRLSGAHVLSLVSADGTHVARTQVHLTSPGLQPDPVRLEFLRSCRLYGTVRDPAGQLLEGKRVILYPSDGVKHTGARTYASSDAEGRFDFKPLEPGFYTVVLPIVQAERSGSFRVFLAAGEERNLDLEYAFPPGAGDISGRVSSASGTYHERLQLTMTTQAIASRGSGLSLQTSVEWENFEGRWEGSFRFSDVPLDDYRMRLWTPEAEDWEPGTVDARPPQSDFHFRLNDALLTFPAIAHVQNAEGSALSYYYHLEYAAPGRRLRRETGGPVSPSEAFATLPSGSKSVRFWIGAPGFVPARGSGEAFLRGARPEAPWEATFVLEPGFGLELELVERVPDAYSEPIEGVRVIVDGKDAGETDAEGRLFIQAGAEPESIRFEKQGFVYASGPVDAASGGLRRFGVHAVCVMRRAP